MKIIRLKLRGFIGIQEGMGLDEIDIDFSNLSGLIALSGPNGKGKTTILENLHPYRTLVSREGELQHHVYLRDSSKELTFVHKGIEYRCLIHIDSHTGKQDCFIYINGSKESVVNGKTNEYDNYIQYLFGSKELYFNSIFCAQGSKNIIELTTGQLKSLFNEYLQLDKLVACEKTAKDICAAADVKLLEVMQKIKSIDDQISSTRDSTGKLESLRARLRVLEKECLSMSARVVEIDKKLTELAQQRKMNGMIDTQITDINRQVSSKVSELSDHDAEYAKETRVLQNRINTIKEEIKKVNSRIGKKDALLKESDILEKKKTKEGELRESLNTNNVLLSDESATLLKLMNKDTDASKKSASEQETLSEKLLIESGRLADISLDMAQVTSEIRQIDTDPELTELKFHIGQCREKMSALELRDPECRSSSCSFIADAIMAKNKLPELLDRHESLYLGQQNKVETLNKRLAELDFSSNKISNEIKSLKLKQETLKKEESTRLKNHNSAIGPLKARIEHRKNTIKDIHSVLSFIATIDEQLRKNRDALKNLEIDEQKKQQLDIDEIQIGETMQAAANKYNKSRSAISMSINNMKERIANLENDKIKNIIEHIATLTTEKETLASNIPQFEIDIVEARSDITKLEMEEKKTKKLETRKSLLDAAAGKLKTHISRWAYIQFACSKDGLRALEIDSVAPTLARDANDLLFGAFGPQDPVKIRTQDPETGREILDMLVERPDGTEVVIDNLSGGQQVWFLKALRLALTLMANHKTGRNLQTAMVDEEDGALDIENARSFIGMYRAFMATGGFDDCIFISHKPECIAMADHVITFHDGGVKIQ